jgi:hypothetical protein
MNPSYTTIITPLDPGSVDACRKYLRDHAEPRLGTGASFIECQSLFPFDRIGSLHFCSFVILEADEGFGPSLCFEATFDGPRDDFLHQLLLTAPEGFDAVYRHCIGYPAQGVATPELVKEYFVSHDVGATTYFSGSPGRTVSQIKDEGRIRDGIVSFLSTRTKAGAAIPGRLTGVLDIVQRDFIRGTAANNWAEQPVQLPWEIAQREVIPKAAILAAGVFVCCLGGLVCAAFGYGPGTLYGMFPGWFEFLSDAGNRVATSVPWLGDLLSMFPPTMLSVTIALTVLWLAVRAIELLLRSATRDLRDHLVVWRFPLHLMVVLRYVILACLVGTVVLAVFTVTTRTLSSATSQIGGPWTTMRAVFTVLLQLVAIGAAYAVLRYWAKSLELAVQLQPLDETRENLRRLGLDLLQFVMFLLGSIAVLLVVSILPGSAISKMGEVVQAIVKVYILLVFLGTVGIFTAYFIAALALLTIYMLERSDRLEFADPDPLMARASVNARKFTREEGGINRFQNHLASITCVKPGFIRKWTLKFVLFAINQLARFYFNKGELGEIPTILSARWVLIDNDRRLLFLDNFGGSWESYLNEFIDLAAVKGLNAIWTNTFVNVDGKRYSFPPTQTLFFKGAQDARPFKAYVRQSQIETIVWYGAYPTFGVVGINANSDTRQELFASHDPSSVDRLLQRL